VDEVEQGEDKRGALGFGDVRQRQGHAPFYAAESPAQLLSPRLIGLIRDQLLSLVALPRGIRFSREGGRLAGHPSRTIRAELRAERGDAGRTGLAVGRVVVRPRKTARVTFGRATRKESVLTRGASRRTPGGSWARPAQSPGGSCPLNCGSYPANTRAPSRSTAVRIFPGT